MIRFTNSGLDASDETVAALRSEFSRRHFVRLPGLLQSRLLSRFLELVDEGSWRLVVQKDFDSESVLGAGAALDGLHFLVNGPAFLSTVHAITGAGPFTWFGGRVYRMVPGAGHHDDWHTDCTDGRLIAMSVNLSRNLYQGGLFQMRGVEARELLVECANTGLGDATLFRVSPDFVHRVTDVEGTAPKTAFAGWFHATRPTLLTRLKSQPAPDVAANDGAERRT